MKPAAPLQSIVDPFVKGIQGELVSELVGNDNPPLSADYLFRRHNVVAELKALEADSFGESFRRKLGERTADCQRKGQLLVYGTARVDSHRLTSACQHELLDLMGAPVQRIVKAADAQIASDLPDVLYQSDRESISRVRPGQIANPSAASFACV